jgi:RNase P/RNase MRP subunit p29
MSLYTSATSLDLSIRERQRGENTMNAKSGWKPVGLMLLAGAVCLCTLSISAQVKTQTSTARQQPTHEVTVERGEVVTVAGNDLVVKMEDGTIRHIPNVLESARVTVEGKELGIHDLKPGMKLERTVTTTTTPQTVTTVQTVTGKVWHVSPPNSVILTLEDGTNQQFKIPKGQKFMVDGQETDAFGLKKGMKVSATKIVEAPETVVTQSKKVTGSMPPPPPPPPADVPILIAVAVPVPAPAAAPAPETPAKLPKTGSLLPLIGLVGSLSLATSLVFRRIRIG